MSPITALMGIVLVALGCDGGGGEGFSPPPSPNPASLVVAEGNNQTAFVGGAVAIAPAVLVRDQDGHPVSAVTVTFAVTGGGGAIEHGTAATGADGIARGGRWNLGPTPGENTLAASTGNLSVALHATSLAFAPAAAVPLTWGGGSHPTVSPDGSRIAYSSDEGIATIGSDGRPYGVLIRAGDAPDWARSSNLIALQGYHEIGVVNGASGAVEHVFLVDIHEDPVWSPDGTEIAFQTASNGDAIVLLAYPSGATTRVPCQTPEGGSCTGEGPTWSPDGKWIAFEQGDEVQKVPRTGGTAEVVVTGVADVTHPAWSPDGRWIAFSLGRHEGGTYTANIWIADARGVSSGLYQLTSGTVIDGRPAWSPDSRTVYFERAEFPDAPLWRNVWKVAIGG